MSRQSLTKAIARIPAEVKEKYTVLKSAPYFLEILDKRVNKGTGVKSLADALNINRKRSWRLAIRKTTLR